MSSVNGFFHNYAGIGGLLAHGGSYSGAAFGDIVFQPSGQLNLSPFNSSGQLEYRFGPHEQFAVKTSTPVGGQQDGFWPFMHSGQILHDISQFSSTLQQLYEAGNRVFITSSVGALEVTSATDGFRVASNGTLSELSLSGLFDPHDTSQEAGDMVMIRHGNAESSSPTSDAEVAAQSLGLGNIMYHSGSGFVNLFSGSGHIMTRPELVLSMPVFEDDEDFSIWNHYFEDKNYGSAPAVGNEPAPSGMMIMSPGLYFAGYTMSFERDSGSSVQNNFIISIKLNGSIIRGSRSTVYIAQGIREKFGTAAAFFIFQANAGDILTANFNQISGPASNPTDVEMLPALSSFWIMKIGPQRKTIIASKVG